MAQPMPLEDRIQLILETHEPARGLTLEMFGPHCVGESCGYQGEIESHQAELIAELVDARAEEKAREYHEDQCVYRTRIAAALDVTPLGGSVANLRGVVDQMRFLLTQGNEPDVAHSALPWAVENRVVKEPIYALFREREDADRFVEDTLDLRVIPADGPAPVYEYTAAGRYYQSQKMFVRAGYSYVPGARRRTVGPWQPVNAEGEPT